jgi:hypothetical protein
VIDGESIQVLRLALRELDTAASTTQTVFLSFLHTRISREEPAISQGWEEFSIVADQSTSNPHAASASLAGGTTTGNADADVNGTAPFTSVKHLQDGPTFCLVDEIGFEISTVNLDLSGTLPHADAGDRRLSTACS